VRRWLTVGWLTLMLLVVGADPAWADPARPSNFKSEVTGVEPAGLPTAFRVLGGDSFLEVTVEPGHTAEIPGYQEEPYIRVEADGTVLVNDRSPSRWVNDDRYGLATPPADATADAPPEWVEVARGGRYAWHDHRIHWMTPDQPPPVVQGEPVEVMTWTVPVVVDGEPADVMGTLRWFPAVSPLPALGVGLVAAVPVLFVWRKRPFLAAIIAVGAAGVAALVVAFSLLGASPPGAGGEFLIWAPPALAVAGAAAALLLRRSRPEIAELPVVGGAVLLIVWALLRLSTLWMPSLPSGLPDAVERTLLAITVVLALVGLAISILGRQPSGRAVET
jgi:hypothetical protein